jgi:guanylate kinase
MMMMMSGKTKRPDGPAEPGGAGGPAGGSIRGRGLLVVVSGPSGVGKTTIVHRVRDELGGLFSVSATTRSKTAQDKDGVDYHFMDEARFQRLIDEDAFLEYAQVFGSAWYGTLREPVESALGRGEIVYLDIDVQGAIQVRERMGADALLVFIDPPSEDELLRRLRGRARDDEAAIQRRFAEARREIAFAHDCGAYDVFVVNETIDQAVREVAEAVRERRASTAERA